MTSKLLLKLEELFRSSTRDGELKQVTWESVQIKKPYKCYFLTWQKITPHGWSRCLKIEIKCRREKKSFPDLFKLLFSAFPSVLKDISKPLYSLQVHLLLLNKAFIFVHFFHFAKFHLFYIFPLKCREINECGSLGSVPNHSMILKKLH